MVPWPKKKKPKETLTCNLIEAIFYYDITRIEYTPVLVNVCYKSTFYGQKC